MHEFLINVRCAFSLSPTPLDDLRSEQDKNKMLTEDMEATLQDIQNM